jgi:hypothetical protein
VGGVGEAVHVTDLGDEHRRQRRSDAGHLLDRLIAAVGVQPLGDHRGEARFVTVEDVDEFQQRADPLGVGRTQWHPGQPLPTGDSEQIRHRDQHAGFGQHRMDLRLQSGSDRDQLGAVAHQLPQLARLGWGDPRLGQSTHPQQIGQIGGVAHVVFTRRYRNPLTPNGCAKCTRAPRACSTSTAQYQP